MPGDSRLKESTRRSFGKKTRRAWNKRKASPASAPLRSAPLPNALDLSGASASLPVDDAAASSSGTGGSSFAGTTRVDSTYYSTAEQAQRAERSEQCKHVLSGKSATQRKFDLLEVNGSCLTSDAGTQFVIVDMKVLNDLFAHARCGSCGAGSLTLSKAADKEYGLAVKLVLVCSTCSFQKKQFSSPRVAGTAKITPFEINMRAMKGIQSIGKGVTALADFCACMNISHRGLHHKTYQGHLKTFVRACENAATDSEAASVAVVKELYTSFMNPIGNINVIFDGSWMTRGRSSHIGVGCIVKLYSGLVIDHVVYSNFCLGCALRPEPEDDGYSDCEGKTQNASESLHSVIWTQTSKNANASLDSVKRAAAEAVAIYNQGRRATNESIAAGLGYATGDCLVRRSIEKDSLRLRKANAVHQSSSTMKERFSKRHQAGASRDYSPGQL
ncbi:hypothetical protein HPB47_003020 [Ixodes persulcatus]|uniref:Uncharacterized protein n=1 Tax=Ixodes persulcatus TaxID=34615 RepID=A0AC60PL91_IXOPE|nr:hypothetical protein HPB47_003020 [Ixodes persulcatus]